MSFVMQGVFSVTRKRMFKACLEDTVGIQLGTVPAGGGHQVQDKIGHNTFTIIIYIIRLSLKHKFEPKRVIIFLCVIFAKMKVWTRF